MFKKKEEDPETKRKKDILFSKVKPILAKQLEVDEDKITPSSGIVEDLGADSLDSVEIVMALEDEFGIEIPDEDAEKMNTIDDILTYLSEKVNL